VINYPCTEFDDFSFSRFGFIMRTDRQTDRQIESQTESQTDTDDCYTHATTVAVSKYVIMIFRLVFTVF